MAMRCSYLFWDYSRFSLLIKFDPRNTRGQQEAELMELNGQYFDSLTCPQIDNLELENLPVNHNLARLGFTNGGLTPGYTINYVKAIPFC